MSGTQIQLTSPEAPATAPTPAPVADPNRPAWLPSNFNSPEDFAKSYGELQSKSTRDSQELARLKGASIEVTGPDGKPVKEEPQAPVDDPAKEPPKEEPPKKDDADAPKEDEPAKQVADAAGVDLTSYQDEYVRTGDVTAENRAKIADSLKGILGDNALEIVNQYVDGQKVVHANDRKLFFDEAGGEEKYTEMVTWASTNLSKEDVDAYNKITDGGDRNATMLAIRGLRAQYEASNGRIPNNIRPSGGASAPASVPFQSSAEMTVAMRDPRYKTDQAYRDHVAARIAASPSL